KQDPLVLAGAAALLLWVAYSLVRKTVVDTVKGAGGLLTGNNSITEGTAYEGKGILGTLGGAADSITGGLLSKGGEWIAGVFASDNVGSDVGYIVTLPDGDRA